MTAIGARPDIRVLYVGGVPRSGSTLTDLVLDRLPGHVSVGELFYLFRNGVQLDNLCGCGQPFSACDFWQEVGEKAFGGWDAVDVASTLKLQARIDKTAAIPAIVSRWRPGSVSRDLDEYAGILRRLYTAVLAVSGADVVVDSSKRPSMAYVLRGMPDVKLTCAQVVRDPRGVAHSFSKVVPLRASSDLGSEMPRSKPHKVARRWVTVNALIKALSRRGVPSLTLRYEDLVADPVAALGRVAALQGIEGGAVSTDFFSDAGLVVRRPHLVAGSRIRFIDGVLPIRLDEQWRRDMPPSTRRLVSAITRVSRARYGYLR